MLPHLLFAIAAVAQLATAFPTHNSPSAVKSALKPSFCVYPDEFVVKDFQIWIPLEDNNRSTTINFSYSDQTTHLETKCHFNETSINVAKSGQPARYACELDWIHFIWQNNNLTLIEATCPYEEYRAKKEAAGWVIPNLTCFNSTRNSSKGAGSACSAAPRVESAVFTTMGPTPSK
ncbi:hypothetical protein C8A05DRAFT_11570 [Staphylotrichum tortipilum]|uniref:AA1-like domain-containing protein n=1 Tax=Staphylotrichum tortipilum TaxID=2831512 RepID=A0AAN6RXS2_9PEZI|nr:hypothetical protein C8A05DRAFT_11570 [Staphylotrichum longicolle]